MDLKPVEGQAHGLQHSLLLKIAFDRYPENPSPGSDMAISYPNFAHPRRPDVVHTSPKLTLRGEHALDGS